MRSPDSAISYLFSLKLISIILFSYSAYKECCSSLLCSRNVVSYIYISLVV